MAVVMSMLSSITDWRSVRCAMDVPHAERPSLVARPHFAARRWGGAREAGAARGAEHVSMLELFFVGERPPLPVAPLGHVHDDHVRMQLRVLRARQLVLKRR